MIEEATFYRSWSKRVKIRLFWSEKKTLWSQANNSIRRPNHQTFQAKSSGRQKSIRGHPCQDPETACPKMLCLPMGKKKNACLPVSNATATSNPRVINGTDCHPLEFQCEKSKICLDGKLRCNGRPDCEDSSGKESKKHLHLTSEKNVKITNWKRHIAEIKVLLRALKILQGMLWPTSYS